MKNPLYYAFARAIIIRISFVFAVAALFSTASVIAQTNTVNSANPQYSRYTVLNNSPQDIAPRLKAVLADFGFEVNIFIDEANSSLAVQGEPQVHQMVSQLLKTLDKKPINKPASTTTTAPSVPG